MATNKNREELLELRLKEALDKLKTLETLQTFGKDEKIAVRHSGYGPIIVIPIEGGRPAVLTGKKGQQQAFIPYEEYVYLKQTTPYFENGYLYTDESDMDNPNLILDVEAWFKSKPEPKLKKAVEEITSPGTLNMLYNFTEGKSSGKYLSLRRLVAAKMSEMFDIEVVEDVAY